MEMGQPAEAGADRDHEVKLPASVDPDRQLVETLRLGDEAAAEHLVATYGDRAYRLAIRITGNKPDAEEAVQDAFWNAIRKIDSFRGDSAFRTWLYRITARAAYRKVRGRQNRRHAHGWGDLEPSFDEHGQHAEHIVDWSAKVEDAALQQELRSVLASAIDDLSDDYRVAFLLRDVEGLSHAEIAQVLDIGLAAVKSRVHRSRLLLRKRLAGYLATTPDPAASALCG
jgi:RNA polymerase sigma-70 factor, ECF subfamily